MKKNSNSLSNLEISAYINNDFEISVDSTYIIDVINDFNNCNNNSISQFIYFPTFGYTHKPFTSKKLNIKNAKNDLACRVTIDKENRKISDSFNTIYCFGGSTTFGWNVSDEHTWPSLLMNSLNKNETQLQTIIKNYGVAGYTATQETNQFIQLIKLGHRPSLCIFMDGYNTGPIWDCSEFTQKTAKSFNNNNIFFENLWHIIQKSSINELALLTKKETISLEDSQNRPIEFSNKFNNQIANRFIENTRIRKAVADLYNIKIVQFLQPNLFATGDTSVFPDSLKRQFPIIRQMMINYPEIYSTIMKSNVGYIDLSKLIQSYPYPAFVDGVHYSPNFNLYLANDILKRINISELKPYYLAEKEKTGVVFSCY